MKMVAFTCVTRRKLIKVLIDFASEYYLFTDGSNPSTEDKARDQLKDASKEMLLNLVRIALARGYRSASDGRPDLLVHYANVLGRHGIETPWSHELPTRLGLDLLMTEVRKYFGWEAGLYSFAIL